MPKKKLALTDAIVNLRKELQMAMDAAKGENLRFTVKDIEVEFKCGVNTEGEGSLGANFWLLDAKAGGKISKETVQTIKLHLEPIDESTGANPKVSDKGKRPA